MVKSDKISQKELVFQILMAFVVLNNVLSRYDNEFYYGAFEILRSLEALFFCVYASFDYKKFKIVPKLCYAIYVSLCLFDFLSGIRISSIIFNNPGKTAHEIDMLVANDYSAYLFQYSHPVVMFLGLLFCIQIIKSKRNGRNNSSTT